MMEGPLDADREEKHEPVSDIDTVVVDSLKALDPEWPIKKRTYHLPRSLPPRPRPGHDRDRECQGARSDNS